MWYMVKPVTVSIDVPQDRERVYEFLDVMANHEPFTDHLLRDWELSGRTSGNTVVNLAGDATLLGRIVAVRITGANPNSLRGEVVS